MREPCMSIQCKPDGIAICNKPEDRRWEEGMLLLQAGTGGLGGLLCRHSLPLQ